MAPPPQALDGEGDHTNNNVDEINSLWNTVKMSYQEKSKQIMGRREKTHKKWISQEAWQKIEERRNTKKKLIERKSERLKEQLKQKYKEADQTMKQLTRPARQTQIPSRYGNSTGRSSTQRRSSDFGQCNKTGLWAI